MTKTMDIQKVIEQIKLVKNALSDKDVAVLLGLTPADFSNRKKRGTLVPLIVEWALEENLSLNDLFAGVRSGGRVDKESEYLTPYSRNVYSLAGDKGPKHWLSEEPAEKIILSYDIRKEVSLVKMAGVSLEPTIRDGAIIAVDCSINRFTNGDFFAVWIPLNGPVVRRAFSDLERLILKAENQAYPDIIIPIDKVPTEDFILGKVKWVLQPI